MERQSDKVRSIARDFELAGSQDRHSSPGEKQGGENCEAISSNLCNLVSSNLKVSDGLCKEPCSLQTSKGMCPCEATRKLAAPVTELRRWQYMRTAPVETALRNRQRHFLQSIFITTTMFTSHVHPLKCCSRMNAEGHLNILHHRACHVSQASINSTRQCVFVRIGNALKGSFSPPKKLSFGVPSHERTTDNVSAGPRTHHNMYTS